MSEFISLPTLADIGVLDNLAFAVWRITYIPCSKNFIDCLMLKEIPQEIQSLLIKGDGAFLFEQFERIAFVNPDTSIALLMDTLNDVLWIPSVRLTLKVSKIILI